MKPILTILSIPFIIVTLGLFLLVINAAMLRMTSWLADELDIGFSVDRLVVGDRRRHRHHLTTWAVDRVLGEPALSR